MENPDNSDTIIDPVEAPAPTESQPPDSPPAVQPTETTSTDLEVGQNDLGLLSDEEYAKLLGQLDDGVPEPESVPEQTPVVETPVPAEVPEPEKTLVQRRYRPVSDEDNVVIDLAKARGISLVQAAAILGTPPPSEEPPAEVVQETPAPPPDEELTTALETSYAELKEAMDNDWGNTEKIIELQRKVAAQERELTLNQIQQQQHQQAAQAAVKNEFQESRERVAKLNPQVLVPNTPIFDEIVRVRTEMEADGDPGLNKPGLPERLYRIAKRSLEAKGIAVAETSPARVPANPSAPAPVRPNPIGGGNLHTQQPTTSRAAEVDVMNMPAAEYDALLKKYHLAE